MTKAKISEYDATAANNTDVNGVNIAEGCPPSGMNNMGREIMAALKRFQTGADGDSVTVGGSLVVSGSVTAANTATLGNVDINGGTIDGVTIGGAAAGVATFTTANATTVDTTNIEVTNIKAKDGTAAVVLTNSTGAVSFANNVTLGDASTDTVTVNGYMGVGGAAQSRAGLWLTSNALSGGAQEGIVALPVGTSSATATIRAIVGTASTAAASFTATNVSQFWAGDSTKGAGSTITNQHGLYIADQTQGTNNYGITSLVSSGTNKWNIYASGTAANYFAGNVGIGTSSPGTKLEVWKDNIRIGNDVTSGIYGLQWWRSGAERGRVSFDASSSTLELQADGVVKVFSLGENERVAFSTTEAVFNDPGNDYDFRVESDTNTHALFVEGTNSNVKIGGSAERATTVGTNHLDIFNGTAPVGTLTNGISIYSSSGEAYVMDAAGNATLFSPHDAETNEWIFKSKHTPTGKVLRIDVEKLLRFVNDHFGLDAVQEFIEP